tara:strand:+ start:148014 stop:149258 length:1245 start_codon:yes stop_codon:yes gene_type:complete
LLKVLPAGSLEARKTKHDAVTFYWRGAVGAQTVRVPIGLFDPKASPKSVNPSPGGYSVEAARRAAEQIAQEHVANRDIGGYKAIRDTKREIARQTQQATLDAKKHTLKNLLTAYCDHLEKQNRSAHKDARSIFTLHVFEAWPQIAKAPAVALTPEQVADMMRRLLEDGKGRTANKLRSYIHAAFQVAKGARFDARIPVMFKDYKVGNNPAADTVPDGTKNRSGKNPLDTDLLVKYWRIIKNVPGLRGALLRLHLLTGGQRIAQLVRLRTEHVTKNTITIFDAKGRPGSEARPHMLPLIPEARKALEAIASGGEYALSTDGGRTHISASTLTKWGQDVVGDSIAGFSGKRVRSGVETLLSKHHVTKDIRGRLQSHGITGVQDVHYDGHDYMPEKRRALILLFNVLEGKVRRGNTE